MTCSWLPLDKYFFVFEELQINNATVRRDVWILILAGVPIAVIGIKAPLAHSLGSDEYLKYSPDVFHQITEQMLLLKEFGVCNVLGLVSTYQETVVCWFQESDAIAREKDPDLLPKDLLPGPSNMCVRIDMYRDRDIYIDKCICI
eukprot:m.75220 g.75220  ORF g.75220 m.75220 type:complete len:145 (-) comp7806_c0_seq6:89-523(-)